MPIESEDPMPDYPFDKPNFQFTSAAVGDGSLEVARFTGREGMSRLFEYHLTLIAKDGDIEVGRMLNKAATLVLRRGQDTPARIHGIISHISQRARTPEYFSYEATLVPRLWRLTLNSASHIFQKISVEELIRAVLKRGGLEGKDLKIQLSGSYPALEYCVQYRETDLQFLQRRLEHYGINYSFDQSGDAETVVFSDRSADLPVQSKSFPYNEQKDPLVEPESVREVFCCDRVVTSGVRLMEYNYETPDTALEAEAEVQPGAPGVLYEYGEHFKDQEEGALLARVRSEEIRCQARIFSGKSDCRLLRAGTRFTLAGHFREEWNRELIVTSVIHEGQEEGRFHFLQNQSSGGPTYENEFEAIPADREYRPPRVTPVPKIPGIMTAKIESSSGDEYAYLDESGRYRMRVPFDIGDRPNGEATRPIRLAQPYAGPNYGIHFPNHAGTEIVWACVDGNVDRPLGLGTIPNPLNTSPCVAENRHQNIIRTASGNEILLDDTKNETQVQLRTAEAHTVLLDDKDDNVQIVTTKKNTVLMDDKNQNITVQTTSGHLVVLDDKNTRITIQSKNGHRISINDADGGENIMLVDREGKNAILIDISAGKIVVRTDEGNIEMHAPNGTIDIKATTLNVETSGDTSFQAANMHTAVEQDYTLGATNVSVEASMDLAQKGMNVTSEADASHKVKGTEVNAESSGPNTIKGAPVMIN